jgi:hypothetical protein
LVVRKLLGAVFLALAAVAGVIGVLWVSLDAVGTEWDYCRPGRECIAGWKIGSGFLGSAAVAALAGLGLLRRG